MKTNITLFFIILLSFFSYSQNLVSQNLTAAKSAGKNPQQISSSYGEGFYWEDFQGADFPPAGWDVVNLKGTNQWQHYWDSDEGWSTGIMEEINGDTTSLDWIYVRDTVEAGDSLIFEVRPSGMYYPDTLTVRISTQDSFSKDSLSLETAFTDTLVIIRMSDFTEYGWYKYKFSLDEYAGQKIYIGFRDYSIRGSGWRLDNVILGKMPRAEIKALSMKVKSVAFTGESVGISAKYFNTGYETQNFTVTCEIPGTGYSKQTSFENVAAGAEVEAQFDPWIPADSGNYTVRIYSQLAGDENTANDTLTDSVKVYMPVPGTSWVSEAAMPDNLYALATASYIKRGDGVKPDTTFLFAIGGRNNSYYQRYIYKYNSVTGGWSHLGVQLPQPLGYMNAALLGGKIYIAGGENTVSLGKFYIYDIEKETMTEGPDVPAPVVGYSMGTYGDSLIYIIGGTNTWAGILNSVFIYNVKAGNWNSGTPIPDPARSSRGGAICGNKIVLAGGGWVENNAVQLTDGVLIGIIDTLNPYNITWSAGPAYPSGPMMDPYSGAWYGNEKKYICFAGGEGPNNTYLPDTWIYDVEKDKWIACPAKITSAQGRSNMAAVVKNDSVYLAALGGNISFHYNNILNVNEWLSLGIDDSPSLYGKNISARSLNIKDSILIAGFGETPSAQFINRMRLPASFEITLEINPGGYKSVKTITNLGYKEIASVDFDEWIPPAGGNYSVKVYSSLEGDEDKLNDTLTTARYVYSGDIAASGIIIGSPLYGDKETQPKASYINHGGLTSSFNVTMIIEPGAYTSVKEVADLKAGDTMVVEFSPWTPAMNVGYTIKTFASLPEDAVAANDTLIIQASAVDSLTGSAWHKEADLPGGRLNHGTAFYLHKSGNPETPDTGYVFVIAGGDNISSAGNSIYKYNSITGAWSQANGYLYNLVKGIQSVRIGGKIYIPGGQDLTFYTNYAFYIYDVEKDSIGRGADLTTSCMDYAMGTYGDSLIYLFGGNYTGLTTEPLNLVQIYNIHTDSWAYGTPFSEELKGPMTGSICGGAIVLSSATTGDIVTGIIDINDPYKITWSEGAAYPESGYAGMAAASWYGKDKKYVFFTGGVKEVNGLNTLNAETWAYDIETNNWVEYPDKISPSTDASMCAVIRNDSVYMAVLGGVKDIAMPDYTANEWLYIGRNEKVTANAAVISLEAPDSVFDGDKVAVKASFINRLPGDLSFTVKMEITPGDFVSVDTVKSLAFKDVREVSFAEWTPQTQGIYTIKAYISSPNDEDRTDNAITSQILVKKSIGTKDEDLTPAVYSLAQNYPNPFNPTTVIKYSIAEAGMVELKIYNMLGQEVETLVNEMKNAGQYEVKFNAAGLNLSSGVYIYRIKSGGFVQTKKLMLIK